MYKQEEKIFKKLYTIHWLHVHTIEHLQNNLKAPHNNEFIDFAMRYLLEQEGDNLGGGGIWGNRSTVNFSSNGFGNTAGNGGVSINNITNNMAD